MKKYSIEFDGHTLAIVEISGFRDEVIMEMLRNYGHAEELLQQNSGNCHRAWLQQLGHFILARGRAPTTQDQGWYELDGSFGIEVTMSEGWEPEFDDVAIHEYSGVAPKSLIKDPKNPFKDVPEGACPNCGAQDTLVDTSAFLTESCKCSACGWEDAHSGGVV